jgi:hypothetical protein
MRLSSNSDAAHGKHEQVNSDGEGSWEFEAWVNQTRLHPLGLALTVLMGLAVLMVDRRYSIWPIIILACFVAPAQRLVIGSIDFNVIRIITMFGMARVLWRGEYRELRWMTIDSAVLAFAIARTVIYTIQQTSVSAFINQMGASFDTVGMYFLFRCLIRSAGDVSRTVLGFVVMSFPVAAALFVENRTGRNAFAFFGGVPEFTDEREGRLRCQGAFAHPIIAGVFWASMLPMVVAHWWRGDRVGRMIATIGAVPSLAIVYFTASSTPVMAVLMGIVGAGMFFLRRFMGYVCLGVFLLLVFMHLSMKMPVWHLIARINIAQGNTGYHRYMLIEGAIHHFSEWFLIGTKSTAHWYWAAEDITNQFILEGVRGGFLTLALFVATIVIAFRLVGKTWRQSTMTTPGIALMWSMGVALFVHCTNFIAVSYFGQAGLVWFLLLAMIASVAEQAEQSTSLIVPVAGVGQGRGVPRREAVDSGSSGLGRRVAGGS